MTPATIAIMGSLVTLGPAEPPADARVTFFNHESNSEADERDYPMHWDGIDITARFNFNVDAYGADQVVITPPLGWTCEPVDCTATVLEGFTAEIQLFAWKGM